MQITFFIRVARPSKGYGTVNSYVDVRLQVCGRTRGTLRGWRGDRIRMQYKVPHAAAPERRASGTLARAESAL